MERVRNVEGSLGGAIGTVIGVDILERLIAFGVGKGCRIGKAQVTSIGYTWVKSARFVDTVSMNV